MESGLRKTDERCADIVSEFLKDTFYSQVQDFERVTDKHRQVKGIDVIFSLNDVKYICDEKAAIRYVNRPLHTFSLELSFIGRDELEYDGWLIDEEKTNNSFLFIWIDKAKQDILSSKEDIEELEIALVKKTAIFDYLENLGWTIDNLFHKASRIRDDEDEFMGNINRDGVKFTMSRQLVEQPINILIPREELIKMSDFAEKYHGNG